MQLRYQTKLTSTDYVKRQAWNDASLVRCPLHPTGGCGFSRHGTYERIQPSGTRIARWYCPKGHRTFSLLPDCLAARYSGTLTDFETAVDWVERAATIEAAAQGTRLEIELPGVLRWLRRRVQTVRELLIVVKGLLPTPFIDVAPTLTGFRTALKVEHVLVRLREMAAEWLSDLSAPLGFRPPRSIARNPHNTHQHPVGPDPPASAA